MNHGPYKGGDRCPAIMGCVLAVHLGGIKL